ncbi:tRNA (guanine-N1-)-methyltransferase [Glaciecola punicea ACAM 611]|jgi:tRNA (guanine37-N1)-methyltransferase|uniref:tRNA (guanine-N(1)-)-methyltransferase n=1 Tax=Glaciecola punicea ACAM 611 TaxID=1121923 RepID=H5TBJ0_9ALTE|nr:tRNA (guanosine(37)-N1)-methyltransferase TrmD [Glaciecola punicea]OFA30963.1 tRNA (guanosine(37)-N1)-methyltransferase TrmD [Glaciecola punicea]GAB55667.1 tRNA (guanine-N1-)-methyltransferase [Glaciecola punicea ACAM 611]
MSSGVEAKPEYKQRFSIVTLFPEMFTSFFSQGVIGRAVKKGLIEVAVYNPRDYTTDKHRTVDDKPYGGGPGMLMMVQPLTDAIASAKAASSEKSKVIYLSPQGRTLDFDGVQTLSQQTDLVLVAGRYEGIDERIIQTLIDEEWSIGDYVLSGGELPAMVLMDAVSRLIPDVLGHNQSAVEDSFTSGLLECPQYTRPHTYAGKSVPEVLLSGNHEKIRQWRLQESLKRTLMKRPDLLNNLALTEEQQAILKKFI